MKSIKVNFKDEQNYKVVVEWLRNAGIEVVELDGSLPTLNVESTTTRSTKSKDEFPKLDDPKVTKVGTFVTVYPTLKSVRYWEAEKYTPDKVRYGIKASLKDAGAEWNDKDKCFTFKTTKALNDWVKAQKEREKRA